MKVLRECGLHLLPIPAVAPTRERRGIAAAAQTGKDEASSLENEPVSGEFPLTPIQNWFFELDLAQPHHWNQAVVCELSSAPSPEKFGLALSVWAEHHDMLRAGFEPGEDGSWREVIAAPAKWEFPWEHLELPSDREAEAYLREEIDQRQAGFRFDGQPLVRVVYLTSPTEDMSWMGIILHHLVTDAISWSVLLEDLDTLLAASDLLPPRSLSFPSWARRLESEAGEDRILEELSFWTSTAPSLIKLGQRKDAEPSAAVEGTAGRREVFLPEPLTAKVLGPANRAYRTTAEELLLAAFLRSLDHKGEDSAIRFALERHGRNPESSRTMGWFTNVHPVDVPLRNSGDLGAFLKEVKESLRAVPGEGRGFGLLRYLCPDGEVRKRMADLPNEQFLFNYLGGTALHQGTGGRVIRSINCCDEASRAPENRRPYDLEINMRVEDEKLVLGAIHDETRFPKDKVETWLDNWRRECELIAQHCLSDESGGFTPSDFPEADLDPDELDALFSD